MVFNISSARNRYGRKEYRIGEARKVCPSKWFELIVLEMTNVGNDLQAPVGGSSLFVAGKMPLRLSGAQEPSAMIHALARLNGRRVM